MQPNANKTCQFNYLVKHQKNLMGYKINYPMYKKYLKHLLADLY